MSELIKKLIAILFEYKDLTYDSSDSSNLQCRFQRRKIQ
jgi:hypothetical protein